MSEFDETMFSSWICWEMPNDGEIYRENDDVVLGESNPKLRKNWSAAV